MTESLVPTDWYNNFKFNDSESSARLLWLKLWHGCMGLNYG